ncbi:MAG: hypothetical protein CMJ65_13635 [Planctomycetaceae bacterium]|jgi:hypothetical protein|nr:hypothetical protein [Planctomycetaceae bacterium]MDP7274839.1 hypothetical protein [Planctomycetaceae bacterium]
MRLLPSLGLAVAVCGGALPQSPLPTSAAAARPGAASTVDAAASKPRSKVRKNKKLSKRQIKQALAFARKHHRELARLVERLKTAGKQAAYDKAVAELSRTAERLGRARKSHPDRHEILLNLWKLESEARLLVARSMVRPDSRLDKQLKQTLRERAQLRRQLLTQDRKRSRERIERIESQLRSLEDLDLAADRELKRLKRTARISAGSSAKATVRKVNRKTKNPKGSAARTRKDQRNTKDRSRP